MTTPGFILGSDRIYYRNEAGRLRRVSAKGLKSAPLHEALRRLQQAPDKPK